MATRKFVKHIVKVMTTFKKWSFPGLPSIITRLQHLWGIFSAAFFIPQEK